MLVLTELTRFSIKRRKRRIDGRLDARGGKLRKELMDGMMKEMTMRRETSDPHEEESFDVGCDDLG